MRIPPRIIIPILLLVSMDSLVIASSDETRPSETATPEACRSMHESALKHLSRLPEIGEDSDRVEEGKERLGRAIRTCRKAAEAATSPEVAAEMMAELYLAKERASLLDRSPRDQRGEILAEGIEAVRGIHHDRSPALVELLRRSGYFEIEDNPERGIELVEQAAEIAKEAYGAEDVRYAEQLRYLGFLFAPSHRENSKEHSFTDAKRAEALYREALRVHLVQENPAADESYTLLLIALRNLFVATGQEEKSEALGDYIAETLEELKNEASSQVESSSGSANS